MQQRAKQEKKEIESERAKGRAREVDGGQGEHYCNLSHTLWQHVCRHFYHFRIYVVSAWAASKLRSRLLLYCLTRSGNGSQHPAPSTQQQTRSVPLPEHVCGLWLARYSNICGTSCQSQHGFARTEDHTPYIATKWIVLVQFIEPKWTEHWATADLAAEARNARKVNIYAGQGAYSKWGFIQCAEMNYCANTSDEFCT